MSHRALAVFGIWLLLAGDSPRVVPDPGQPASGTAEPYTIKRIMKLAHLTPENRATRNNLDNKVLDGKATEDEQQKLVKLYTALSKSTPPAGKLDDWKRRTGELVGALRAVYDGEEQARERFIKARDCKACHQVHRT